MLKRLGIALAITLAALVAIDRASLLVAPCMVGSNKAYDQKANDDENCATSKGIIVAGMEWLSNNPPEFWTAIATIAIAAFTGTLWFSSEKMWRATKLSADIARDALISTERAFVFLNEITPDYNLRPHGKSLEFGILFLKPHWGNNGNTPTKNMKIQVGWTDSADDLPDDFPYQYKIPASPMFLGPKAYEWSKAIAIPGPAATKLFKGGHIYVWGRADYEDIFEETQPHFTEWCYRLDLLNTEFPVREPLRFQPVAFGPHNRTDEDARQKQQRA